MPDTHTPDERLARAAWSRLTEPGDPHAGATLASLGAVDALAWLRASARRPEQLPRSQRACVERWAPRLEGLEPERDVAAFSRLGGRVVIPGDPEWPEALADLGPAAPHALWVRGAGHVPGSAGVPGGIAMVGSRASTRYGETVARELAFGIADAGYRIISGGAYGIDAAAHRGALAATPEGTVAVLAGGADRLYPAGNEAMLRSITEGGLVIAELAPGASPTRHRFLARNRVIAALGAATVVVEAAHRSGALSTANHAADLLRPLGAVPGPVTSAASSGCHRLLREGKAVCVTMVEEVLELAGPAGVFGAEPEVEPGLLDGLDPLESRVFDALPAHVGAEVSSLVRASGLGIAEVLGALGSLQIAGRVRRSGDRWARVTS
nr:DNA-protecting protein DprA [Actinomycetales bacterium]